LSVSNFDTPSPISVALDLYAADVRLAVSDRADTIVEVRPGDPDQAADVKAAENTRVGYDEGARTLSVVCKKPRNRFVNFSSGRPESIDVLIRLPTRSALRGEADLGDFQADGALGAVAIKVDLGTVHLGETGPLRLRNGVGKVTVEGVSGSAEVHCGSGDLRIGAVDGTAEIVNGSGRIQLGVVTGPANIKNSNGSVYVERALSDITAASSNGEVRIGEVVRGDVSAATRNGGVEVGVREGSAAWLELHTEVGRVYNELDSTDAPEAGEPVDKVAVRAGTKLGDITIRRTPRLEDED
jgi:DUF4097 and DUF4098 domain-containing protein YvlB